MGIHRHSRRPSCLRGPARISCSQPFSQTLLPGCGKTYFKTAECQAILRRTAFRRNGPARISCSQPFSQTLLPVCGIYLHTYISIYISQKFLLEEARKLTSSREILLWMTPSEAPKALQASECSELLDPMRASCWIFAQH